MKQDEYKRVASIPPERYTALPAWTRDMLNRQEAKTARLQAKIESLQSDLDRMRAAEQFVREMQQDMRPTVTIPVVNGCAGAASYNDLVLPKYCSFAFAQNDNGVVRRVRIGMARTRDGMISLSSHGTGKRLTVRPNTAHELLVGLEDC